MLSNDVDNLLTKADRSLEAAGELLRSGYADFAASRAYYGCFYVAEALLLSKGLSYSRHSQVVAQYGQRFAKTGELNAQYHRLLISAFSLRQTADYSAAPDSIEPEDAKQTIEGGRQFLSDARSYMNRPSDTESGKG